MAYSIKNLPDGSYVSIKYLEILRCELARSYSAW